MTEVTPKPAAAPVGRKPAATAPEKAKPAPRLSINDAVREQLERGKGFTADLGPIRFAPADPRIEHIARKMALSEGLSPDRYSGDYVARAECVVDCHDYLNAYAAEEAARAEAEAGAAS